MTGSFGQTSVWNRTVTVPAQRQEAAEWAWSDLLRLETAHLVNDFLTFAADPAAADLTAKADRAALLALVRGTP